MKNIRCGIAIVLISFLVIPNSYAGLFDELNVAARKGFEAIKQSIDYLHKFENIDQNFFCGIGGPTNRGITAMHWAVEHQRTDVVEHLLSIDADYVTNNNKRPPIHEAALLDDLTILKLLLKKNPELVNAKDRDGSTALHIVAGAGKLAAAKLLYDNKCIINKRNKLGMTPLHNAVSTNCINNTFPMIKWLIESGADVHMRDKCGRTPLLCMMGSVEKNLSTITYLVEECHADPNVESVLGETLPIMIVKNYGIWGIEELTALGCDLNKTNKTGETALSIALSLCCPQTIMELMTNGADKDLLTQDQQQLLAVNLILANQLDPNAALDTHLTRPLHVAVRSGDLNLISQLLAAGGDPKRPNAFDQTPFDYALQDKRNLQTYGIVRLLASHMKLDNLPKDQQILLQQLRRFCGEEVRDTDEESFIVPAIRNNLIALADFFINCGLPFDTGVHVRSPLGIATSLGNLEAVKVLLNNEKVKEDINNVTSINIIIGNAIESGNTELVEFLFDHLDNDKIGLDSFHHPLVIAISEQNDEMIALCRKRNVLLNVTNNEHQMTALHCAAIQNDKNLVEQLLLLGAIPDVKMNNNKTPADLAKNPEIKKMLQEATREQDELKLKNLSLRDEPITNFPDFDGKVLCIDTEEI